MKKKKITPYLKPSHKVSVLFANIYKENNLRKISFTIFLNNDFEGGEFDMDFMSPNNEIRYQSFDNTIPLNTCLFYHSYNWFRIRPITNGIKKSLSGYILGPKYK